MKIIETIRRARAVRLAHAVAEDTRRAALLMEDPIGRERLLASAARVDVSATALAQSRRAR